MKKKRHLTRRIILGELINGYIHEDICAHFFKESNRVEILVPRGQLPIRGLLHLFFMIFPLIHPRGQPARRQQSVNADSALESRATRLYKSLCWSVCR